MARGGIKITKANIWDLIRNLIYCGKIFVTKYKDQESRYVKKLHEPLIFEELF
ncbi:recombinase family protein [Flavobacterium sp. S87F.05.LMB.W.Kidney.N]|uniref:recombinase family protein n=1 Tax=Flavobacterium sp. S87F.05.LMB.W.Kidney.N TaxID=1278758 RepID=UPI0010665A89|nr:recombinase family protein [Flavobacterium sp. S87F.05.LMB.W.Kidney.N]